MSRPTFLGNNLFLLKSFHQLTPKVWKIGGVPFQGIRWFILTIILNGVSSQLALIQTV